MSLHVLDAVVGRPQFEQHLVVGALLVAFIQRGSGCCFATQYEAASFARGEPE